MVREGGEVDVRGENLEKVGDLEEVKVVRRFG